MAKKQARIDDSRFYGVINLDTLAINETTSDTVEIEMLRVGKFDHPAYGEIDISQEKLDAMVKNFYDNVLGRNISFDWNHERKKASAWLKDVKAENGVLIGTVKLTKAGKESIGDEEYKYFSIEYVEDYEDPESGDAFGPTIKGGALTNRPFISKLKPIEFEEVNGDASIYRYEEDKNMPGTVKRTPVVEGQEDNPGISFEELKAQKDALEAKVKELESSAEKSKSLEELVGAQKSAIDNLTKRLDDMATENKKVLEEASVASERNRVEAINIQCETWITNGQHPAVVAVAKDIMLSDKTGNQSICFSETVQEGDKTAVIEKNISLSEAIKALMAAIPSKQPNVDLTEKTTSASPATDEELTRDFEEGKKRGLARRGIKLVK